MPTKPRRPAKRDITIPFNQVGEFEREALAEQLTVLVNRVNTPDVIDQIEAEYLYRGLMKASREFRS